MFSGDPTIGSMQYHLFLEYLLGLNMKGVGMQVAEDHFYVILSIKINV